MICFHVGPCCAAASVANKKRGLQIWSIPLIEIQNIQELLPCADPGLSVAVTSSCSQEKDWEVKVTKDGGDLAFEFCKAPLITLHSLWVIPQTDTALIGYDHYGVPG